MEQKPIASNILKLSILLVIPTLFATVASVPTSVLVQNSELNANNDIASLNNLKFENNAINKVKRSSNEAKPSTSTVSTLTANNDLEKKSSPEVVPAPFNWPPARPSQDDNRVSYGLPDNYLTGLISGIDQNHLDQPHMPEEKPSTSLYKRGISAAQEQAAYSYAPAEIYTNPFLGSSLSTAQQRLRVGSDGDGAWADELDPVSSYGDDLQDLDDYTPAQRAPQYHPNRAYDNLQNLLNTDAYLEPMVLPYSGRYYGIVDADRKKRSNPSKLNKYAKLRPKRDAKLTPADMLALVALVEAGERARKDSESESNAPIYTADGISFKNSLANNRDIYESPLFKYRDTAPQDDDDYKQTAAAYYEPNSIVDYYGEPLMFGNYPKYETEEPPHPHYKYGGQSRFSLKRFMVAKKNNRPYGNFLNVPVDKPSTSYLNNPVDENYF